jgi:acyl-CoA thioester hydrolase
MSQIESIVQFRVRYSETDQMGTFYNSRALEWFECGRTEFLRKVGLPYTVLESKGLYLPLIESHVEYLGRARYDDLLRLTTTIGFFGRARVKSEVGIVQAETLRPVARGYTIHVCTDAQGNVMRPPKWFSAALAKAGIV